MLNFITWWHDSRRDWSFSNQEDAGLIFAAQKVEHYEIATYGALLQLAITMELDEVADLLDKTLRKTITTKSPQNQTAVQHEGDLVTEDTDHVFRLTKSFVSA